MLKQWNFIKLKIIVVSDDDKLAVETLSCVSYNKNNILFYWWESSTFQNLVLNSDNSIYCNYITWLNTIRSNSIIGHYWHCNEHIQGSIELKVPNVAACRQTQELTVQYHVKTPRRYSENCSVLWQI